MFHKKEIVSFSILIFGAALLLNACSTRQLTLVDFETGQTLEGSLNQYDRSIDVTMPDGEILSGMYSEVSNSSPVYSTGVGISTGFRHGDVIFGTGVAVDNGPSKGYALLKSNTSSLMMEITVNYSNSTGHGYGEAITNDDRKYKVQF